MIKCGFKTLKDRDWKSCAFHKYKKSLKFTVQSGGALCYGCYDKARITINFLEYCAFLAENPNPCRNCARQEKVSCLWCNKRRTWSSESDKIIHDLDIDFDNKQIQEHLLNISKHSDLLEQLQK